MVDDAAACAAIRAMVGRAEALTLAAEAKRNEIATLPGRTTIARYRPLDDRATGIENDARILRDQIDQAIEALERSLRYDHFAKGST